METFEPMKDLAKIKRMVKFIVNKQPSFDIEGVAADIWLELWQKNECGEKSFEIPWMHVRNRCIDRIRHLTKLHISSLHHLPKEKELELTATPPIDEEERDSVETLNLIMSLAHLSAWEMKIIFGAFYTDQTRVEMAASLELPVTNLNRELSDVIEKLRRVALDLGLRSKKGKELYDRR